MPHCCFFSPYKSARELFYLFESGTVETNDLQFTISHTLNLVTHVTYIGVSVTK